MPPPVNSDRVVQPVPADVIGAETMILPVSAVAPMRKMPAAMLSRSAWSRPRLPALGFVPRSMFSVPGLCCSVTLAVPALIGD